MRGRLAFAVVSLVAFGSLSLAEAKPAVGGAPWGWGRGLEGQIGLYGNHSSIPVQVPDLATATSVSGGSVHSLALTRDGRVWAWGSNLFAQRGNGTIDTTEFGSPIPSAATGLSRVSAISAGGYHNLALMGGTVWSWGDNALGQLGHASAENCSGDACSSSPARVSGLSKIRAIAAGDSHSLALRSNGTVVAWGYNVRGQLGNGTTQNSATPIPVTGLTGVIAVSAGVSRSSALKTDGTVWVWGDADGTTPQPAMDLSGVVAIDDNVALKSDGTVWYFSSYAPPFQVAGLSGIRAIATGGYASLALKSNGVVLAWGGNFYGGFGNGTTLESSVPVQTSGLWKAVGAGTYHSLGIGLEPPTATPTITSPTAGETVTTEPVVVTGTALAGSTVFVNEGNTVLGQGLTDQDGNWSISISVSNGTHSIVARAQEPNGNISNPSPGVSFSKSSP